MADSIVPAVSSSISPYKGAAKAKKAPSQHPRFIDMVIEAITLITETERKGASLSAIKSHIVDRYKSVDPNQLKFNVKRAIERGLEDGKIIRPKKSEDAKGVTGRFKIDKAKLAALKKEKTDAAKPKPKAKPAVKKVARKEPKSPKVLKTPKKTSKSKTVKAEKVKGADKKIKPATEKTTKTTKAATTKTTKPKTKTSTAKAAAIKVTTAKKKAAEKPKKSPKKNPPKPKAKKTE